MIRIPAGTVFTGILLAVCLSARGQGIPVELSGAPETLTTLQDDATLFDVAFTGKSRVWAVGDRGVVWKSEDAGQHWEFVPVTGGCRDTAFHSVCFLTDRVGWIAGGRVLSMGAVAQGVVLFTSDGGETWTDLSSAGLPPLRYVRFFGLEEGVAVGERSTRFPGGVLRTEDGGSTWQPVNSSDSSRWQAAAFLSASEGLLAGSEGSLAVVAQGAVHRVAAGTSGLRGFQDVSVDREGRAWLVGDGAVVLCREAGSNAWSPPRGPLPRELDDWCDLRTVEQQGRRIWLSGSPGSVIWHSPDEGETWRPQPTGDAAPLTRIRFADEQTGIAVGQFGRILRTDDGGQNWQAVRGAGRRLACLQVAAHADRTDLEFLARWSLEDGYRAAALVATRSDLGPDRHVAEGLDVRLQQAVRTAGGNGVEIDWRFPLALPSLERRREQLIEEWTQLTDRRLSDVMLGSLVAKLRMWRPSVVLLEEPEETSAAAELVRHAMLLAIEQASDPSRFPLQQQLLALEPWTVRKVVLQRRSGIGGVISLNPFEPLPRQSTTLDAVSRRARSQLGGSGLPGPMAYTVVRTFGEPAVSDRLIFGDLPLSPDSAARRDLPTLRNADFEKLRSEAEHRRSMTALGERLIAGPDGGAQLIGQLAAMVRPLSHETAALQLADLARMYREQGEWANAEAVYLELVSRYPREPASIEALGWLVPFWTSAEMNWQRLRTISAQHSRPQVSDETILANLEQAFEIVAEETTQSARERKLEQLPSAIQNSTSPFSPRAVTPAAFESAGTAGLSQHQLLQGQWQDLASLSIRILKEQHPQFAERPDLAFVTASLMRRRGQARQADELYAAYLKTLSDDPWHKAARGEMWLLVPGAIQPKPVVSCRRTRTPPVLDGLLSDPCWAGASEVRLKVSSTAETYTGAGATSARIGSDVAEPILMFCYDERFLYIAASVPIDPDLPDDPPQLPGRSHDADLGEQDRLAFQFDIDRDYVTYYQFEVDQRGWTRESCWDNQDFDPQWFCAVERSAAAWRVEMAIPLQELLPPENVLGATWAMGLTRIRPGRGVQSWTGSGAERPHPPLFGFLRFE